MSHIKASNVDKKSVEGEVPVRLCNYVDVYKNQHITADLPFMEATATRAQVANFSLRSGDTLITKDSETPDDIGVPAYVPENLDGVVCGYHLSLIRPDTTQLHPAYLAWVLKSQPTRHHFTGRANGVTRFALGYAELGDAPIPVPELEKQRAIVRFLDEETAKINALIQKKTKLVHLFHLMIAVLSRDSVTRGLDLTVAKADWDAEGVEQIPTHWSQMRLGNLLHSSNAGEVIDRSHWHAGEELLYTCAREPLSSSFENFRPGRRTELGDLLLTRNGTPYVHFPEPNSIYTNVVQRIRLIPEIDPLFAAMALSAATARFRGVGDIIVSFNMSLWGRLAIPVPPMDEQLAIRDFVSSNRAGCEGVIRKVGRSIASLTEYRSALITAAVTGQIDIPGAA